MQTGLVGWIVAVLENTWIFITDPLNAASLIATIFAIWGAVVAHVAQRKASTSAKLAAEREATALELQRRATTLQEDAVAFEFQKMLMAWADEVLSEISRARLFVEAVADSTMDAEAEMRKKEHAVALSILLDRGRLYFDNISRDLVGMDRPERVRGFRPPILDAVALAALSMSRLNVTSAKAAASLLFKVSSVFLHELKRYASGAAQTFFEEKGNQTEIDWDGVSFLVDEFEETHGRQSFWAQRPLPRRELLDQLSRQSQQ